MALSPDKIIDLYKNGLKDGSITTMEPLLSLFMLENNPMTLIGREPMIPLFKLERPKRMTLQAGRQVSKSMNIGLLSILGAGLASMQVVIFEPRFTQKRAINTQILAPLLRGCSVSDRLIRPTNIDPMDVKKFLSGGNIFVVNSLVSADPGRGLSGISQVYLDEIQDMNLLNIPVLEAVADAKVDTGFRVYSGTAKTLDGALAVKFEQSSQGHWCVKCLCGKYNIFAPEEQLFSTIKDKGCSCAFCDRILDCSTGGFIHKFPSRVFEHPGYHLPQVIFPFHHTPNAWKEIIYKKNNIPKTQFYNEVLGVSDSDSVRLLTKSDLLAARNNVKSKEQAVQLRGHYDLVVLGVDWGGGGGGESATGLAVVAKSFHNNHFETLYMRRLPTGLSPEQEASIVESVATEFRVDLIAHDFTGAGFMREAFFVQAYPEWASRLFPVTYSFRPNASLVNTTASGTGARTSYVIDKSKSLLLTMSCIKHAVLTVPWFDPLDAAAPQLDFLAIIEHKNQLEDAEGNVVQRRSEVYLLDKVAGVRDDAAQAVNIGFIAACHTLGQYPVITYDSKFDISDEQRKLLLGE